MANKTVSVELNISLSATNALNPLNSAQPKKLPSVPANCVPNIPVALLSETLVLKPNNRYCDLPLIVTLSKLVLAVIKSVISFCTFLDITAKVKQAVGAKLGVFKFSLPGGVEIDYDGIKSMGDEEMERVLEEIKGDEGVDWMMHS